MILDFYSLREQPFGTTPDPRFFFPSETHREALASLLYGIDTGRGFLALISQPGMGKTTLIFRCLAQTRNKLRSVFLFQTICTPLDFLKLVLEDLGEKNTEGGIADLQSRLIQIVMAEARNGTQLIIIVDEAQNLDNSVLELIRMLSNFETSQHKLMHIMLCGQPQLARKLASPELVQLRQRISIIARLDPLSPEQTASYINHRLRAAGRTLDAGLFDSEALRLIATHSGGLPRNINNLCFNAITLGCVLRKQTIDAAVIHEVIGDLAIDKLADCAPPSSSANSAPPLEAPNPRRSRFGWIAPAVVASTLSLVLTGIVESAPGSVAHSEAGFREAVASGGSLPVTQAADIPSAALETDTSAAAGDTIAELPLQASPVSLSYSLQPQTQEALLTPAGLTAEDVDPNGLPKVSPAPVLEKRSDAGNRQVHSIHRRRNRARRLDSRHN
jgi:type II secretory pathway predicted ATPase ExeA